MIECGEKQQRIFIAALNETGKAYPKEMYIDDSVSPEAYLENNCIEYFAWGYKYEYIANISRLVNDGLLGKATRCKQCGKYYVLTSSNIAWCKENELSIPPKRCKACCKKNKEKNYLFS